MIQARFRLWLREELWITEVSRAFPDATLRLLTGVPLDDRTLELGETQAEDPMAVTEAICDHPDILEHERLHCDAERALSKYVTRDQALFEFLGASSLLPEFPLVVEDGVMTFGVTATREEFDAFGDRLDVSGFCYELLSVTHREEGGGPLTGRQLECLTVAERMGYFEVPRECTLAEVADTLGVDPSTVSETIRRGAARVLEQFFMEQHHSGCR
ncbi:helix-turn-helix domain-containing protein [Haloferax sulfurifontis]|uniref:Bacterio-opsin activator HTH domain-containing protein n=1 Tax=Haloferax sulfurifontis ATCC BAA-897 TaxID=662480 RepID=M0ILG7_9EURY|nr:helix-turn-helix domain-containing protein [Haloferax sulfurifontis]ELZ96703.1 Bacterio-opsin activator HTH domain-containing protein [Haloferax sulfurifontis ATCC BAA-897]